MSKLNIFLCNFIICHYYKRNSV